MKVLDYLLIIGFFASLAISYFLIDLPEQRNLLNFISGFCAGGIVGRIGRRLCKKYQENKE